MTRSEIAFSQVREDPLVDERVVQDVAKRTGRPARVLMVASGGCTALGLLALDSVAEVIAVDANPAQLHLVELRRRAMDALPLDEQAALLGAEEATSGRRAELYDEIRTALPDATRAHWDARPQEIGHGVLHVGRFEALFRELAEELRAEGLAPLAEPERAVASPAWRPVFERVFERTELARIFGPSAVDYSMDRSFGEHFADVFARALGRWSPGENYFLHQVFEGRYLPCPGGRPPCLTAGVQRAARSRGLDRLELHAMRFDEALGSLAHRGPFDVVQTSNLSDWMPVPALRRVLARIRELLVPGGAVIGRRLNGDHHLAEVFGSELEVDEELSATLLRDDRSFFYREVVVGHAPERAA